MSVSALSKLKSSVFSTLTTIILLLIPGTTMIESELSKEVKSFSTTVLTTPVTNHLTLSVETAFDEKYTQETTSSDAIALNV